MRLYNTYIIYERPGPLGFEPKIVHLEGGGLFLAKNVVNYRGIINYPITLNIRPHTRMFY
jgi:hypothetical protein